MKTITLYITSVLLLAAPAIARIGETETQIEARYGKTIGTLSRGTEQLTKAYAFAGMHVGVTFVDGKSASEFFWKQDESDLSENETAVLLAANSEGKKWIEHPVPLFARGQSWELESADRVAQYHKPQKALMIYSRNSSRIADEQRAKDEKEKLKGL